MSEFNNFHNKNADISTKNIILGGDFNLFCDSLIETEDGNPILEKRSLAKMTEMLENCDLCDIWRIRNTKTKHFTIRQKNCSGLIQRRLDYFFISNIAKVCETY